MCPITSDYICELKIRWISACKCAAQKKAGEGGGGTADAIEWVALRTGMKSTSVTTLSTSGEVMSSFCAAVAPVVSGSSIDLFSLAACTHSKCRLDQPHMSAKDGGTHCRQSATIYVGQEGGGVLTMDKCFMQTLRLWPSYWH